MSKDLTPSVERLINASLSIEDESAIDAGELGFMARAMTMATLPHRKVEGSEFERRNGNFTLHLLAPAKIGLPYGSMPRLLLAWLTTEAVRTKSRELELGDTLSGFMAELGISRQGSNIASLKNQARRLFASTVSATYQDKEKVADIGYRLADKTVLWWHAKDPEQAGLWRSSVTLSEAFYNEVVDRPVPIDMRAMKALRKSPLALDIYTTLTYRMSYLSRTTIIPWQSLAFQLGADYKRARDFKAAFDTEMRKVKQAYPALERAAEILDEGLRIGPAPTHIPKKRDKA